MVFWQLGWPVRHLGPFRSEAKTKISAERWEEEYRFPSLPTSTVWSIWSGSYSFFLLKRHFRERSDSITNETAFIVCLSLFTQFLPLPQQIRMSHYRRRHRHLRVTADWQPNATTDRGGKAQLWRFFSIHRLCYDSLLPMSIDEKEASASACVPSSAVGGPMKNFFFHHNRLADRCSGGCYLLWHIKKREQRENTQTHTTRTCWKRRMLIITLPPYYHKHNLFGRANFTLGVAPSPCSVGTRKEERWLGLVDESD